MSPDKLKSVHAHIDHLAQHAFNALQECFTGDTQLTSEAISRLARLEGFVDGLREVADDDPILCLLHKYASLKFSNLEATRMDMWERYRVYRGKKEAADA
jgi:hypothetical protein